MGTATARLGPRAGAKRIGASGGGRSGPRHGPGPGHLHLGSSFSLPRADISGTGVNRGTGVSGGGAAAHMKAVTGESRVATASAGTRAEGRARNHLAALLRHVLCAASRPVTTVSILETPFAETVMVLIQPALTLAGRTRRAAPPRLQDFRCNRCRL